MNESDTGIDTSTDVRVESPEEEDTQVLTEERTEVAEVETSSNGSATETTDEPSEEKKKKGWLAPLGVGLGVVLLIAAVALLLLMNPGNKGGRRGGSLGEGLPQAQWKFTSFPIAGQKGKLPGEQEKALEKLIRRWSDAVYLFPGDLRRSTQRYFTTPAANAFRASDVGLPKGAREVQTRRRAARIWIDIDGARRAAAHVEVIATGRSSSGEFRTASDTRLWLERDGNAWKVIGYDVDQRPLPANPNKGKDKGKDKPSKNKAAGDKKDKSKTTKGDAGGKS